MPIFLLQSTKGFCLSLRHVTEYVSFLLTYQTLATEGVDSYMGYNTHLLLYVSGHRAAGPWLCKDTTSDQIYSNQYMNTDPRELVLFSGISIVSMFSVLECFFTNPSHPQEEHGVLISTYKAFTFLLSVKERNVLHEDLTSHHLTYPGWMCSLFLPQSSFLFLSWASPKCFHSERFFFWFQSSVSRVKVQLGEIAGEELLLPAQARFYNV